MKTAEHNASSLALYIGKSGVLRCEYAARFYWFVPLPAAGNNGSKKSRIRWPEDEGERLRQSG